MADPAASSSPATLEGIGVNIAVSLVVLVPSVLAFGYAVKKRSNIIAPRATARPRNVIFNPDYHRSSDAVDVDPSQRRGNALFGWIPWTLSLSYATMLEGVPGTGTRKGGLSGIMLKVGLDGVVLLRFQAFCFRISCVTSLLGILFLLPIYVNARCYHYQSDYDKAKYLGCPIEYYNLTDYEQTTIANVPILPYYRAFDSIATPVHSGTLARLYGVTFCFWIIVAYTLWELHYEWIALIAMRRVYYLETDVWGERRNELVQTQKQAEHDRSMSITMSKQKQGASRMSSLAKGSAGSSKQSVVIDDDDSSVEGVDLEAAWPRGSDGAWENGGLPHETCRPNTDDGLRLTDRDPWIPNPERRDCTPNVSLYSVLIGGLPSLPEGEVPVRDDPNNPLKFSKRDNIQWQLAVATALFDECVPNQPGFSSSVAAVSLYPDSSALAGTWGKWYKATKKHRHLWFIRKLIAERRQEELYVNGTEGENKEKNMSPVDDSGIGSESEGDEFVEPVGDQGVAAPRPKEPYFYDALRTTFHEGDVDSHIDGTLAYGPDQGSLYAREYALAASGCCPLGFNEDKLRRATLEELLDLEQTALAELHDANDELREAQGANYGFDGRSGGPALESVERQSARVMQNILRVKGMLGLGMELGICHLREQETNSAPYTLEMTLPSSALTKAFGAPVGSFGRHVHSKWTRVEYVVTETRYRQNFGLDAAIRSGTWKWRGFQFYTDRLKSQLQRVKKWSLSSAKNAVVDQFAAHSTYAIVTFTSRQSAVAARHCLLNGRAAGWANVSEIPIPPLAHAAPWDVTVCRNICRPVTISISQRQQIIRHVLTIVFLVVICLFWVVPITFAQGLLLNLASIFPDLHAKWKVALDRLAGLLSSLVYSLFTMLLPNIFRAVSNFGSNATSAAMAELRALQYYWWFMTVISFSGQLLTQMALKLSREGLDTLTGAQVLELLQSIALTIPSTQSYFWLNWTVTRCGMSLPMNTLLQFSAFLFACLRLPCLSRIMLGGGAGPPIPYSTYVDNGIVLMCCLALAPQAPLVALACFTYFLFAQPVFRRNVIFIYRPNYDGGGLFWPFLSTMCISALLVGEILMTIQMALKEAIGPTFFVALTMIPTLLFHKFAGNTYAPAYQDAALLQTSRLDGWHNTTSTMEQREEFRRFLVDAHKAAYIPICIAGTGAEVLTVEPAVVVPVAGECMDNIHATVPVEPPPRQRGGILSRVASELFVLRTQRDGDRSSFLNNRLSTVDSSTEIEDATKKSD